MHPGCESLLVGDAPQERRELGAFVVGERGAEVGFVLGAGAGEAGQGCVALLGHVQGVVPAILRVTAPLDDAGALEVVDEGDEPAGVHAELLGDGLLAAAGLHGDGAEQPALWGGKSQRVDPFGEPGGGVRPELGQQERRPRRPAGWPLPTISWPISCH